VGKISEKYADVYMNLALSNSDRYKKIAEEIIPYLPQGALKIIDLGTGPGLLPIEIVRLAKNEKLDIFGADLCEKLLRCAKDRSDRCVFVKRRAVFLKADVQFLPFANRKFDAVIATGIIHALDNPVKVFDEVYRVLKPGGIVFIYDPARFDLSGAREKKFIKSLSLKNKLIYKFFSFLGWLPPKCWSIDKMNQFVTKTKFQCLEFQKRGEKKEKSDYWRIILQKEKF
jgi:ubiquinone/menaquinone biosynthesis C-methylase UbiE